MLRDYPNKMLKPNKVADKGVAPPGRCPGCGAEGPVVVVRVGLRRRKVVEGCRCKRPPEAGDPG